MNSRPLKFRVWDKLALNFIYPEKGHQNHYILSLSGNFYNLQNESGGDEYEVCQFTGLKDSNGKEIYEGDIIEGPTFYIDTETNDFKSTEIDKGHVWYSEMFLEWTVSYNHLYSETSCLLNQFIPESTKIIGNIFENSELLK